jgi:peptidylprolyl isomerase
MYMRNAMVGDTVRVHYVGRFADGTEFDSSAARGPIEVTIGGGQVIRGFENALVGIAEGETKHVTLQPKDAYGTHDPRLIHTVGRDEIPPQVALKVAAELQATNADGHEIRLRVIELNDDNVTLDANHPLAGKTLTFELGLVDIIG